MRRTSADKCLDIVLEIGGWARKPLLDLFRSEQALQDLRITFIYGEKDVFTRANADKLVEEGVLRNSSVHTVYQAGHHLAID